MTILIGQLELRYCGHDAYRKCLGALAELLETCRACPG